MTILSRTEQKGRSMVEMLGVLAIIGVLSVGGISGYSKAMAKYKLTKAQDQITMLLMNIRTAYATSPNYSGLTSTTAIEYHIAPGDMIVDDDNLSGAFGGAIDVNDCTGEDGKDACKAVGVPEAGAAAYFYIQMANLGAETCMSLASSDWGSDGLMGLYINAAAKTSPNLPLSLGEADDACNADGNANSITWIYY